MPGAGRGLGVSLPAGPSPLALADPSASPATLELSILGAQALPTNRRFPVENPRSHRRLIHPLTMNIMTSRNVQETSPGTRAHGEEREHLPHSPVPCPGERREEAREMRWQEWALSVLLLIKFAEAGDCPPPPPPGSPAPSFLDAADYACVTVQSLTRATCLDLCVPRMRAGGRLGAFVSSATSRAAPGT